MRYLDAIRELLDAVGAKPQVIAGLRDMLGEFRSRALFILDEAHHAAPSSGARYAISSQLTRAVRDLAERFEHRLFLSATPHNGHSNSFSALLEMLDPQRFTRGVDVARYLKAVGDPREVVSDPEARYFGGRVEEHSLVPLAEARLGRIGFDEWLRRSQAAA